MAKPSEKLAESLEVLHALQEHGVIAIRSGDLTRTHRERLCQNGFLQEVMKGWYIPARPDEMTGESTAWYGQNLAFALSSDTLFLCTSILIWMATAVWDDF